MRLVWDVAMRGVHWDGGGVDELLRRCNSYLFKGEIRTNLNEYANWIRQNNENMAIEFLINFKDELDYLTKCKLLRVILNSGNKEVIDSVIDDGLLSESNVKKYINKRK